MYDMDRQAEKNKVGAYLRRICDLTSPNLPRFDDCRGECRQYRTIPILLTPWENGHPVVSESVTALTKDICDRGLSVTLPAPFRAEEVVVGISLPGDPDSEDPRFLLGATRQNVPIGGGFWALGIEGLQIIVGDDIEPLLPMAKARLKPRPIETLLLSSLNCK